MRLGVEVTFWIVLCCISWFTSLLKCLVRQSQWYYTAVRFYQMNNVTTQGCPGFGIAYTTHQKWSEWKTNRSAVITGLFRRKRQGWGRVSRTKWSKNGQNWKKKQCFLQNRPAIRAFRVVSILTIMYAIPIPGHPCIPVCLSSCPFVIAAVICYSQQVRIL